MSTEPSPKSMDDLVSLCKRRGFIFQASEIYGGINGFWDYGPLGAQLKNNIRDAWWEDLVLSPPEGPDGEMLQIVGLDSAIIQNPKVWEASGHVGGFNDPMIDDRETKGRFRADHLLGCNLLAGDYSVADAERDIAARARAADPTLVPEHTIIASTVGEAVQQIVGDKATQKRLGLKNVQEPRIGSQVIECTRKGVHGFLWVVELPSTLLERHADRIPSPFTDKAGALTPPRAFNLMFETYVGAIKDEDSKAYLRPETAQGIFLNYKNVLDTSRVKVPFGIAQIGKAFRNEVTPRNFIFRSREFEQMEMEFFCHPDDAVKWFEFWKQARLAWWKSVGIAADNMILRDHDRDELAHYAKTGAGTADIEYRWPFTHPGFGELEGIAHRSNFDLNQHQKHSGAKLEYFDQERNERYLPHVIEPASGLTRGVLAALCEAFTPDADRPSGVVMKFHPRLSPIKAAVFPLVKKDGMPEVAAKLTAELRKKFGKLGTIETDEKQSIGKRYARMDEAGCPVCFTIDGDTLSDQTVTVRDRDTASQERIGLDAVVGYVAEKLGV